METEISANRFRVKVYQRQHEEWVDLGTGFIRLHHDGRHHYLIIQSGDEILLQSEILEHKEYQEQQGTIMLWSEENVDIAISFQESEGCEDIQREVRQVQKLMTGDLDEKMEEVPILQVDFSLPDPSLSTLETIEIVCRQAVKTAVYKDNLTKIVLETEFMEKLLELLEECEELECVRECSMLSSIIKSLFHLNNERVFHLLLQDPYFMIILGMLEYENDQKADYRDYFDRKVTLRVPVPTTSYVLDRVKLVYRVNFIKDVALVRSIEDSTIHSLSYIVHSAQNEILQGIQKDEEYFYVLFDMIRRLGVFSVEGKECLMTLIGLCGMVKQFTKESRGAFYGALSRHGVYDLFDSGLTPLKNTNSITKDSITKDSIESIPKDSIESIESIPKDCIESIESIESIECIEASSELVDLLVLLVEQDAEKVRQKCRGILLESIVDLFQFNYRVFEILLLLLDCNSSSSISNELESFLEFFFTSYSTLFQLDSPIDKKSSVTKESTTGFEPVTTVQKNESSAGYEPVTSSQSKEGSIVPSGTPKEKEKEGFEPVTLVPLGTPKEKEKERKEKEKEGIEPVTKEKVLEESKIRRIELLTALITSHHSIHTKKFLFNSNILSTISSLLSQNTSTTTLKLSCLKLFRTCLTEEFYRNLMLKVDVFKDILDCLIDTKGRYNILNSACLDFFNTILNNHKSIILHLVATYKLKFSALNYTDIFKNLITKYDDIARLKTSDSSSEKGSGGYDDLEQEKYFQSTQEPSTTQTLEFESAGPLVPYEIEEVVKDEDLILKKVVGKKKLGFNISGLHVNAIDDGRVEGDTKRRKLL